MQEVLSEINWAIIAPILIIQGILMIVALFDLIRTNETNGPKWMWLVLILFVSMFGPVLYFIFGRGQD